jgi:cell wall-associated NlpC family hydrolase
MTLSPAAIVERARALVGVPFRPQGRDPKHGLDCAGLVLSAFAIEPDEVRRDYRLRGPHAAELADTLSRWFDGIAREIAASGDVLLFRFGKDQSHLAISCGDTFIHADAALRRVVETPNSVAWPVMAAFRMRPAD